MAYASFQSRVDALEVALVAVMAAASVVGDDKSSVAVVVAADTGQCTFVDSRSSILLYQFEAEAANHAIAVAAAYALACIHKASAARSVMTGLMNHALETVPRPRLDLRGIWQREAEHWECAKPVSFDCDLRSPLQPMVLRAGLGLGMHNPAANSSLLQH